MKKKINKSIEHKKKFNLKTFIYIALRVSVIICMLRQIQLGNIMNAALCIFTLILFLIGMLIGTPVLVEYFKTSYITKVPSAILATGVMILSVLSFQSGIILDTITRQNRENYELNLLRYEQMENIKKHL